MWGGGRNKRGRLVKCPRNTGPNILTLLPPFCLNADIALVLGAHLACKSKAGGGGEVAIRMSCYAFLQNKISRGEGDVYSVMES